MRANERRAVLANKYLPWERETRRVLCTTMQVAVRRHLRKARALLDRARKRAPTRRTKRRRDV